MIQICLASPVPTGSDVEWILDGTGSISSGSARSRSQLNAVQRKSSPASLYRGMDLEEINNHPAIKGRNPWTDRRPSDLQAVGVGVRRTHTQNSSAWAKGSSNHIVVSEDFLHKIEERNHKMLFSNFVEKPSRSSNITEIVVLH